MLLRAVKSPLINTHRQKEKRAQLGIELSVFSNACVCVGGKYTDLCIRHYWLVHSVEEALALKKEDILGVFYCALIVMHSGFLLVGVSFSSLEGWGWGGVDIQQTQRVDGARQE